MSSDDAKEEDYKTAQRCATIYEKTGGCECTTTETDSPICKITNLQELFTFFPEECLIMFEWVNNYCDLKKGESDE